MMLNRGKSPFSLENIWLQAHGFTTFIKNWWELFEVHGSNSFVVAKKLKLVKESKKWRKEAFGNVKVKSIN